MDNVKLTGADSNSSTGTDEFCSSFSDNSLDHPSSDSLGSDEDSESDGEDITEPVQHGQQASDHQMDGLEDNGSDADDELSIDSDSDGESNWDEAELGIGLGQKVPLGRWVRKEIEEMYAHRYEVPRDRLPRGPSYLQHVLTIQKTQRPDHFRQALRVSPATFDAIVAKISPDPVFCNHSDQPQISVEQQLAVTLYRFGHDGNAASLQSVANWAGIGKGTVSLITRQVMTVILRPTFLQDAVRMPTTAEKENVKKWVEEHSCEAWRGGWCMVDSTLVPLAYRPYWFGESYFDRKCNYSLNVQVFSDEFIYLMILLKIAARSCQCPTCRSSTSHMVIRGVPMTLWPGGAHIWLRSIQSYLRMASGFGPTLHTQYVIWSL
jgi:hypothetical protein